MGMKKLMIIISFTGLLSCQKTDTEKIQQKLVGTWSGTGEASWQPGETWQATFTFEENGHYSAHMTSDSPFMQAVYTADDNLDHEEKKLVIHYLDSFEKAYGVI